MHTLHVILMRIEENQPDSCNLNLDLPCKKGVLINKINKG